MLSAQENELLTRVGPSTPMGNLMRQYWLPALVSGELPAPNCPPRRLRLLGEDLIAFRLTSGRIGMIQNACPHRGASLFFGRNEEEGLRCVYHGWKFDATGQCVDMPSEPPESVFKTKVKAVAYPCVERGGVVWTYMGPRSTPPSLPDIEVNMLDEVQTPQLTMMECNWLQAIEGDLDTSHLGFLHLGSVKLADMVQGSYDYYMVKDRAPRYVCAETEFGTSYGAYRPTNEGLVYWRIGHFMFPFYTFVPTGDLGTVIRAQVWVPLDDEHTMYWGWSARGTVAGRDGATSTASNLATGRPQTAATVGGRVAFSYLPNTSDFLGRWRLDQNKENDYLIDRESQHRGETFTGIPGVRQQDKAVTEGMGAIMDRTQEHLGTSDSMIIQTRIRLMNAAQALAEDGTPPPGVDDASVYRRRSGSVMLPREADWLEATRALREPGPEVALGEAVRAASRS